MSESSVQSERASESSVRSERASEPSVRPADLRLVLARHGETVGAAAETRYVPNAGLVDRRPAAGGRRLDPGALGRTRPIADDVTAGGDVTGSGEPY